RGGGPAPQRAQHVVRDDDGVARTVIVVERKRAADDRLALAAVLRLDLALAVAGEEIAARRQVEQRQRLAARVVSRAGEVGERRVALDEPGVLRLRRPEAVTAAALEPAGDAVVAEAAIREG